MPTHNTSCTTKTTTSVARLARSRTTIPTAKGSPCGLLPYSKWSLRDCIITRVGVEVESFPLVFTAGLIPLCSLHKNFPFPYRCVFLRLWACAWWLCVGFLWVLRVLVDPALTSVRSFPVSPLFSPSHFLPCIPLIWLISVARFISFFRGFSLLSGTGGVGRPSRLARASTARGSLWCFLCTQAISRLVLNEGFISALDYYRRARCAYIMGNLVFSPRVLSVTAVLLCSANRENVARGMRKQRARCAGMTEAMAH